ncbi:ISL3 family transposase [Thermoanaerobacter wiegelii]|uniref:Transposase IS204/IS1001/IS1096/IS1165 family protein n=1 Tax=Thermoanaerobacter wiegelii Rt8.B1 TaxID=697303 RepID=G2MV46_9THEO|nr:ISL3 family transposase [Thermoanaerobacter wiegelii]AEM78225.1 transposase IS204/IS1001/IS1096/IS1165 family protein [Thermoanaerobacter wiegelii Rt8.B1]
MQGNYITKFLKSEEVIWEGVIENDSRIELHIKMKQKPHICPRCGEVTSKIHDYRVQRIKDVPLFGKPTVIVLKKRRYVCSHCGKKFYEHIDFLPRYHRMTNRLSFYILQQLKKQQSMKDISEITGVSITTVMRLLDRVGVEPDYKTLPEVISIDEFKGNSGGRKYHCIIVDPKERKILDILKDRKEENLSEYFKRFRDRDKVKWVIIDMWKPFSDTVKKYFKRAKIAIDKFHFTRYIYWAIENVRKRIQKELPDNKRKYFKRSRKLLLAKYDNLTPEQKEELEVMFWCSDDLRIAYLLKEEFNDKVLKCKNSKEAKIELKRWIQLAKESKIDEFKRCVQVFNRWFEEIANAFDIPYTNSVIEGYNNKIKVLKRIAYGYRNFYRFRKRILYCNA